MENHIDREIIGQEVIINHNWAVISKASTGVVRIIVTGISPEDVRTKIIEQANNDWDFLYNLGYRIIEIQNIAKIMSLVIEK